MYIIGSNGQLGAALRSTLINFDEIVKSHKRTCGVGAIEDELVIARSIEKSGCKTVLNLAALTDVERCEKEPELAYLLNETLAGRIGKVCADLGLRLIHISSDMVYGHRDKPSKEWEGSPCNVYAKSKRDGDYKVLESGGIVLRTNFISVSRGLTGKGFVDWALRSILARKKTPLFNDFIFNPVDVLSLYECILDLMQRDWPGRVVNIGCSDSERLSKLRFVESLLCSLGLNEYRQYIVSTSFREIIKSHDLPGDVRMDISNAVTYGLQIPTEEVVLHRTALKCMESISAFGES